MARSPAASDGREPSRQRVIEAALDLLLTEGIGAVTTRATATAAGVQAPAIYRLFGDKDGLLDAVAEQGYAQFVAAKADATTPADPVEDLRTGWDLTVEFGVSRPALYALANDETRGLAQTATFRAGRQIFADRLRRLALAGLLAVDEQTATAIIQATARAAVQAWFALPADRRDPMLLRRLREAMITSVTTAEPAIDAPGAGGAARALRAALPDQHVLSPAEQVLLAEWLDRLDTPNR